VPTYYTIKLKPAVVMVSHGGRYVAWMPGKRRSEILFGRIARKPARTGPAEFVKKPVRPQIRLVQLYTTSTSDAKAGSFSSRFRPPPLRGLTEPKS
jgi:hypothetical protein